IFFDAAPRQMLEERLADAPAPLVRLGIEVFQPDTVPTLEGGIGIEPERKAHRPAIPFRDLAEDPGLGPEEIARQVLGGDLYLVEELFVLGQFADEADDEGRVGGRGGPDGKVLV